MYNVPLHVGGGDKVKLSLVNPFGQGSYCPFVTTKDPILKYIIPKYLCYYWGYNGGP